MNYYVWKLSEVSVVSDVTVIDDDTLYLCEREDVTYFPLLSVGDIIPDPFRIKSLCGYDALSCSVLGFGHSYIHKCVSHFFLLPQQNTWQNNLVKEKPVWLTVRGCTLSWWGSHSSRLRDICDQEAEMDAGAQLAFPFLFTLGFWLRKATHIQGVGVSYLFSNKPFWKYPHRHTQRGVLMITLNPASIILKINHTLRSLQSQSHRVCSVFRLPVRPHVVGSYLI